MTNATSATNSWLDTSNFTDTTKTTTAAKPQIGEDPAATKQMFLELLVAQIKNQNPLNPQDGAEFLAQLSQFTGVEQMLGMRQELQSIHSILKGDGAEAAAPTGNETQN